MQNPTIWYPYRYDVQLGIWVMLSQFQLLALKGFFSLKILLIASRGSLTKTTLPSRYLTYKKKSRKFIHKDSLQSVILEMTKNWLTAVISQEGELIGMITDGDLSVCWSRQFLHLFILEAKQIMTKNPKALKLLVVFDSFPDFKENAINTPPVTKRKYGEWFICMIWSRKDLFDHLCQFFENWGKQWNYKTSMYITHRLIFSMEKYSHWYIDLILESKFYYKANCPQI